MNRPRGRRWRWVLLATAVGACASTPPAPKRWEPEVTPELRDTCRKSPLECRQAAEKLAGNWTTEEEAFGALKAFTAACQAGDAESCAAVDRRFTRVRYLGPSPAAPPYPKAAREKRFQGTWVASCTFTRAGEVTGCTVERPVPELDGPFLEWIRAGSWQAATLDGRPFGCDYRLEFKLWIS